MKTIDRYLCADCERNLREAQIIYKKIPNTQGEKDRCEWCRKMRSGSMYRIRYGRDQ